MEFPKIVKHSWQETKEIYSKIDVNGECNCQRTCMTVSRELPRIRVIRETIKHFAALLMSDEIGKLISFVTEKLRKLVWKISQVWKSRINSKTWEKKSKSCVNFWETFVQNLIFYLIFKIQKYFLFLFDFLSFSPTRFLIVILKVNQVRLIKTSLFLQPLFNDFSNQKTPNNLHESFHAA